jgi:hypothetical protein
VNDLIDWLRAQIDIDEQWALAASAPDAWRGNHPPILTGVRWTWAVGENWEPYTVDPLEEHVGDSVKDYSPTLVTIDEWPHDEPLGRWTHFRHRVLANAEEVRSVDGGHIVNHDPARVLREVAAKRLLIGWADSPALPECETGYVLAALAAVYSNRPGWREEWSA